jgi:hypothetical protein
MPTLVNHHTAVAAATLSPHPTVRASGLRGSGERVIVDICPNEEWHRRRVGIRKC